MSDTETVETPVAPPPTQPEIDIQQLIADNLKKDAKIDTLLGEKKKVQAKLSDQENKFNQIMEGFGQLLGLEQPQADPKVLTQQVAGLQDQLQLAQIEQRATSAAYRAGIDPDLAVPVLRAQGKLGLDLSDPNFDSALAAAISGLAETYPQLAGQAAQAAPRPKVVPPTPSGATPATSLEEKYNQVIREGNTNQIAAFIREHGAALFPQNPNDEIIIA